METVCGKCGREFKQVSGSRVKFLLCLNCGTSVVLRTPAAAAVGDSAAGDDEYAYVEPVNEITLPGRQAPASRRIFAERPAVQAALPQIDVDSSRLTQRRQRRNMAIVAFGLVGLVAAGVVGVVVLAASTGSQPKAKKVAPAVAEAHAPVPLPPLETPYEPEPAAASGGAPVEAAVPEPVKPPEPVRPQVRPSLPDLENRDSDLSPARPRKSKRRPEGDESPAAKSPPPPARPAPSVVPPDTSADPPVAEAAPPAAPRAPADSPPAQTRRPPKVENPDDTPAVSSGAGADEPADTTPRPASFRLPPAGGAVMLNDGKTLVVAITSQAKLAYIDTVANKELKQVEVDFAPAALAVQGNQLIAATKGSSTVHILTPASGKLIKSIKVTGEPIKALACNPRSGLVYATNTADQVISIDPVSGASRKTAARGQMIAVGAADRRHVYTGIQKPIRDTLVFQQQGNQVHISSKKHNINGGLLQYEVQGDDLRPVTMNDNAADNGRFIAVSPDGKLAAMAGGGGWKSKNDSKRNYCIAIFDTSDMKTMAGQVDTDPFPAAIGFHPKLSLGAVFNTTVLSVFSTKSFTKKDTFRVQQTGAALFVGFGGNGTKVIYVPEGGTNCVVEVFPVSLSDKDKAALKDTTAAK